MFNPVVTINDITGGINSKQRPTKIKDNESVEIVGFDFDANSMKRAKGYTKLGEESDVSLTGKTIYTHVVSGTNEMLVKTIGTYIKYLDTVSGNWYKATVSTFTADLRWCFDSFNGYLYGVNGTDNWIFWNASSKSTLASSITPVSTTIPLATGTGVLFSSGGGTAMIEDDQITYTGVSVDTLTGVTGISANHASGVTIITELDASTYSSLEKATRIAIYKNRMYAISALNGAKILWSKLADNTNPQTDLLNFTVAGSGAGDAGFDFDKTKLVTMKAFVNSASGSILTLFNKYGTQYSFVVTDSATTTTDSFIPIHTDETYPIQPHLVIPANNDLLFVDQYGHVQGLNFENINSPMQGTDKSFNVHPSLEITDFDDGYIGYSNNMAYFGGASTVDGINDVTFYYDYNYKAWGAYIHWDAVDITIYNGNPVALSQVTGDVFNLNDGYSVYIDDPDNDNQGDYLSEWVSKEWEWNRPFTYKQSLKARMGGIITTNCPTYMDIFMDGALVYTFLIDGSDTNILTTSPNVAVGTIVFGRGVMGGLSPGGSVRKEWQAQLTFTTPKTFIRLQARIPEVIDPELLELIQKTCQ
jgi:hypothetical protein